MTKICEHFKKNSNGLCENYTGDTETLQGCRNKCKKFKVDNKLKVSKKLLEKQIIGFETPYEK